MPHFVLDARTATPHFPGIGRYVTNLARALIPLLKPDERLTILLPDGHPEHPVAVDWLPVPPSGAVQTLFLGASLFSLSQQTVVPRLLRSLGADLYHSAYYLMPCRPGVPTLLTVYDLIPLLFPEQSTLRARLFSQWMTQLALYTAGRIIAVSEATRRDFLSHFRLREERICAIPLAADPVFHPQPLEAVRAVQARYGLPARYVLYLGSNKPHKNLARLVEAWAVLRTNWRIQSEPVLLVIAGAWDPRYPAARERAKALALEKQVKWLGSVSETDLSALYSGAYLFVFPSLCEGFGLPVLEAMACGAPVVCSNRSSLPEVVGDAALLADPLDINALAAAIARVLGAEGLRQEMREKGLVRAQLFTWEKTARRTLEDYRVYAHPTHL